jgi:hypothetical protein
VVVAAVVLERVVIAVFAAMARVTEIMTVIYESMMNVKH